MKNAIVYSSRTGNTKMLAEAVQEKISDCTYFGAPDEAALTADRIYVGFWTDKGTCDADTEKFLKTLKSQQVFLFGTAGFGGESGYYEKILDRVKKFLPETVKVTGTFMCQGKMPMSVRQRYEGLQHSPTPPPNIGMLIDTFDRALSHPDQNDLQKLREAVRNCK